MYGNEFFVGTTVYPDLKKMWNAAVNFALEFHTDKKGTNINVGDMATVQGGVGRTFYKKGSGVVRRNSIRNYAAERSSLYS